MLFEIEILLLGLIFVMALILWSLRPESVLACALGLLTWIICGVMVLGRWGSSLSPSPALQPSAWQPAIEQRSELVPTDPNCCPVEVRPQGEAGRALLPH